jgi:hypothetical protein
MDQRLVTDCKKLYQFVFNDGDVDKAAMLVRRAVLFHITSILEDKFMRPKSAAACVLYWWRGLLPKMREIDGGQINRMVMQANCQPSTVCTDPPYTLVCSHPICPWCYSRRAQNACRGALADFGADNPPASIYFSSVVFGCRFESLRDTLTKVEKKCRQICSVNKVSTRGSAWQVFPTIDNSQPCVVARIMGTSSEARPGLMVPGAAWEPEIEPATKENLKKWFIALYQYPSEYPGIEAADLVKLVDARKGLRLNEVLGSFRVGARRSNPPAPG